VINLIQRQGHITVQTAETADEPDRVDQFISGILNSPIIMIGYGSPDKFLI